MIVADRIDSLIKEAMMNKTPNLEVYRAIKTKLIEYRSARNASPLDDLAEVQILRKMAKERQTSANEYLNAGREDLSSTELYEYACIEALLPPEPSTNVILATFEEIANEKGAGDLKIPKNQMGVYIKEIKKRLPLANNLAVSEIVKQHII